MENITQIKGRGPKTIKSSVVVKCWSLKKLTLKRWEKSFCFKERSSSYVRENKKKNKPKPRNPTKLKKEETKTTKEEDKMPKTPGLGKIIPTLTLKLCATSSPGAEERNCAFWKPEGLKIQN